MRAITQKDIDRWKLNTIETAIKSGYDKKLLNWILANTRFAVLPGPPPDDNWFGWCHYDSKHPEIEVYSRNLSTEGFEIGEMAMLSQGMPKKVVEDVMRVVRKLSEDEFYEIYNQSGMDHEIIGHLYHWLSNQPHSEEAASKLQLKFASARSAKYSGWKVILRVMPVVLGYHKNIDELKSKDID